MPKKTSEKAKFKSTLNELDTAVDQWNSLINKASSGQGPSHKEPASDSKSASTKGLLEKLSQQLDEFSTPTP